jgi:acyl-CoA hydrolase
MNAFEKALLSRGKDLSEFILTGSGVADLRRNDSEGAFSVLPCADPSWPPMLTAQGREREKEGQCDDQMRLRARGVAIFLGWRATP